MLNKCRPCVVGSIGPVGPLPGAKEVIDNVKPMTVADLVALLQTQPQDLLVAYRLCSEQVLLGANEIEIAQACEPRPDGWIQDKRPDKPSRSYLMLPGN